MMGARRLVMRVVPHLHLMEQTMTNLFGSNFIDAMVSGGSKNTRNKGDDAAPYRDNRGGGRSGRGGHGGRGGGYGRGHGGN